MSQAKKPGRSIERPGRVTNSVTCSQPPLWSGTIGVVVVVVSVDVEPSVVDDEGSTVVELPDVEVVSVVDDGSDVELAVGSDVDDTAVVDVDGPAAVDRTVGAGFEMTLDVVG